MSKTATAKATVETVATVTRPYPGPGFVTNGQRTALVVKAGTVFTIDGQVQRFDDVDTPVLLPESMTPGSDYFIRLTNDVLIGEAAASADLAGVIGGFHFAPGGNASAREGGDELPAINPWSCWDVGWRPACADPRGMTAVDVGGHFIWVDIYLLGTEPFGDGTSKFDATIADGAAPPAKEKSGRYRKLDQPTAVEIYAAFGKSLLGPEEFFAAAFGVTEGTSRDDDPETTGLDAARTSKWGVMQAAGNMSTWGTDGDPDGQRHAWRFGGDWVGGGWAGSRYAIVGYWPGSSGGWIGARGRSDHLNA